MALTGSDGNEHKGIFIYFEALKISRLPPGGPGRRSTVKPAVCSIRRITPLAQYVVRIPLEESRLYSVLKSS